MRIRPQRPFWSSYLDARQYERLRSHLLKLSDEKMDINSASPEGTLPYKGVQLNLSNLLALLSNTQESEWDDEINRWLQAFNAPSNNLVPHYPNEIQKLALRLYPREYFDSTPGVDFYLTYEDIPGIFSTIVVNRPDRVTALTKDEMGLWAEHAEETRQKLLSTLEHERPHHIRFARLNGADELVAALLSDDVTGANHALVLDKIYPQLLGENGALVGIPHRHMILVKRLDNAPSSDLIDAMGNMVAQMQHNQPGPISDKVYQLKAGEYKLVK